MKDAVKKVGFSREKLSLVPGKEKSNDNDHKKDNNINTKNGFLIISLFSLRSFLALLIIDSALSCFFERTPRRYLSFNLINTCCDNSC